MNNRTRPFFLKVGKLLLFEKRKSIKFKNFMSFSDDFGQMAISYYGDMAKKYHNFNWETAESLDFLVTH